MPAARSVQHSDAVDSGTELARRYYREVVAPLLLARWPGLPHAGARLGSGSDVLGLDDATSRDHDWGLRLTVLVEQPLVRPVREHLERVLPDTFAGWPTRFGTTWDPVTAHRVDVDTAGGFAAGRLGIGVDRPWDAVDWLSVRGQAVLEVTAGPVFTDTLGAITTIRDRLRWYPGDIWRYAVATAWNLIGEELPLLGRAATRGDDLGAAVIAARVVQNAMHLGFLLERRWPPYPKWFGTAFAALPTAGATAPALGRALAATAWPERQAAIGAALTDLRRLQDSAGLPAGTQALEPFFDRPFQQVHSSVTDSLLAAITDPAVRALPAGLGTVDQWMTNTAAQRAPHIPPAALRAVPPPPGVAGAGR
jgi:hypothetical protein